MSDYIWTTTIKLPANAITIWHFWDVPKEFKQLSCNGGDEDWVAYIPKQLVEEAEEDNLEVLPEWMMEGTSFGCCKVEEHYLADGSVVAIGCHA